MIAVNRNVCGVSWGVGDLLMRLNVVLQGLMLRTILYFSRVLKSGGLRDRSSRFRCPSYGLYSNLSGLNECISTWSEVFRNRSLSRRKNTINLTRNIVLIFIWYNYRNVIIFPVTVMLNSYICCTDVNGTWQKAQHTYRLETKRFETETTFTQY